MSLKSIPRCSRSTQLLVFLASISLILFFAFPLPKQAQSTPTLDSEEQAFLTILNNYRAQNGVGSLQASVALTNSAEWMSNDMAQKNYFSHTDSLGRDPFTRMAAFGYGYNTYKGENLAAGNSAAQATFDQLRTACDPDALGNCTYAHNQNMLNPNFKVIGISRVNNNSSTYKWYWTNDFGGYVDQTFNPNGSATPTPTPTPGATPTPTPTRTPTPDPCTACTLYKGTISGTGAAVFQPNNNYYFSAASGNHNGWLRGLAGTNFNLYLWKWNGSAWMLVARSESATSTEQISYPGTAGYYVWQITSANGGGSYSFWLQHP